MANLHRLALLLLLTVCSLYVSQAKALTPTGSYTPWTLSGNIGGTGTGCGFQTVQGSTPEAATSTLAGMADGCQTGTADVTFLNCDPYNAVTASQATCYIRSVATQGGAISVYPQNVTRTIPSCPAGSTLTTSSTCTCNAGTIPNATNNGCVASGTQAGLCASLTGKDDWMTTGGKPAPGQTQCSVIGCTVMWQAAVTYTNKQTGVVETEGPVTYTGAECTYDPAVSQGTSPDECKGGAWGQINGINTCVPHDPNKNTVESTKPTSGTASGSSTPASGGASSPTGTTTTTGTETTTCDSGRCTTTRTTEVTNPDGSKTTATEATTQMQSDYCKDNPKAPICVADERGTWGGSCDAGYQCNGDAALCAAAQGIWKQKCALLDAISQEKTLYENTIAAIAAQGAASSGITVTSTVIGSSSFDQSNALGVQAQCISNVTVTVWGQQLSLPFNDICPHLATLGNILMSLSFLIAMIIVFKKG